MCRMCDDPTVTKADLLAEMAALVEEYGWAIQWVTEDRVHPPWAYTVGLTPRGLPELVVTGLQAQEAGELLNDFADGLVHHDERLTPGERLRCPHGREMEVLELAHPDVHLVTAALLFPGATLRALQIVWTDDRRRWPWDVGFRGRQGVQTVLGPRSVGG